VDRKYRKALRKVGKILLLIIDTKNHSNSLFTLLKEYATVMTERELSPREDQVR